jgi:hypothetical protein
MISCTRSGCHQEKNELRSVVRGTKRREPQANFPHRFSVSRCCVDLICANSNPLLLQGEESPWQGRSEVLTVWNRQHLHRPGLDFVSAIPSA